MNVCKDWLKGNFDPLSHLASIGEKRSCIRINTRQSCNCCYGSEKKTQIDQKKENKRGGWISWKGWGKESLDPLSHPTSTW